MNSAAPLGSHLVFLCIGSAVLQDKGVGLLLHLEACSSCSGSCLIPVRLSVPVHPLLCPAQVLSAPLQVTGSPVS